MDLLSEAAIFATQRHHGQVRDGEFPLPYITHPMDVLAKVRYIGQVTEEPVLCAAVLHDVVEECGVKFAEIQSLFGDRVEELVRMLTRREPSAEEVAGMNKDEIWKLRSEWMLGEIRDTMDPQAQTIKLADRLSNLQEALRTRTGKKLDRYFVQTQEILKIIPRKTNKSLWDSVKKLLPS
ncbi:MAG: bifunctional (p)ppGpp synthetase/guanosine-3',5'-bis(diphosphate) 3'-pyrophosphohydrolase [Armatimonadetes bacterium]|nr:bifunctional (p)ppGpp synthetase/guanosine-3',5'-bis(diphosphate) 3'-pyrophosphohydrolase [Armatimonadota bacterium]